MRIIAAVDERWGIGKDGKLLTSIPADMKNFQSVTSGHTVVMGRKTLESFPGKRPLKNRRNIVLTSDQNYSVEGAEVVHSVEEMLSKIEGLASDDVYCIGGAQIYRELLPYCDSALITKIDHVYDADAYMPDLDKDPQWEMTGISEEQIFFDLTYHFCEYKRKDR